VNKTNKIHSTVIIEGNVEIGVNNVIHPFTVLIGPLKIGDNNIIGPHVVIGSPGQDTRNPRYDSKAHKVSIGNNNIIREFCAIHKSCYGEITEMKNDIYVMQGSSINHDVVVEDKVVIASNVAVAGLVHLLEGSYLGMGVTVNQRCVVGHYSIVAQGVPVVKNIKPFSRHIPKKLISVNKYAIQKYGLSEFENEITNFVVNNNAPSSQRINLMTDQFYQLHLNSKKELY
jgi:UDP-N-acetylglucosamine acyltransferase